MGRKILIVDDSQLDRQTLCKILREDYEVLEATNGEEALEALDRSGESLSAVILDIAMQEMEGYETLAHIRGDQRISKLPVIVITGDTDAGTEHQALSLGATDFISKPYNPDVVRHRLENAIRLHETSNRTQAIVDSIASGVTAVVVNDDKQVEYIFVTDRYYELLGYTREQYAEEVADAFGPIHRDDVDWVLQRVEEVNRTGEAATLEFRAIRRDGREIWLEDFISLIHFAGIAAPVQLSVFTDITERKKTQEALRMSEEWFRIAAEISGQRISRYDIKSGTYHHDDEALFAMGFASTVENVPQAFADAGRIAPECLNEYFGFYDKIRGGEKSSSVDTAFLMSDGKYRWIRGSATVIPDSEGQPSQAIIVSADITEQREKEAAFLRLQYALRQKEKEAYTLFRWNLIKDMTISAPEGSLINVGFEAGGGTFDDRARAYGEQCVCDEDREDYLDLVNTDGLLANFHRGKFSLTLDYREALPEDQVRWLRLTITLMQYERSADVEALFLYENIDAEKKAELQARVLAETDPLTGVLNRAAFVEQMEHIIRENKAARHTLLMLDIDGFKLLNDVFGHAAGDQALVDIANSLRSTLRHGDLLGRLGGDEFLICLRDIPYDAVVEKKARQIGALVRKVFSLDVQISASIGIAVYPDDGEDFDTLYRNADAALYSVKSSGKDNYAYFNREAEGEGQVFGRYAADSRPEAVLSAARRRMLIVDDNEMNRELLVHIFKDDFIIETASDGNAALMRIRHYGSGLSVVLLDLLMPGMDGFAVLEKMQDSVEMQTIPVIVVSGQNQWETSLKAIKSGAADFVTKPVDPDLIRYRVQSAISRAENERLRAQNSYLLLQSSEEAKYRTVLDSTGTVVIEYDWVNGVFSYDSSISRHVAGKFDNRKLWRILLSDMVAEVLDVKAMQELVFTLANDRKREDGSMMVLLRTPSGEKQWFRMSVFKRSDEYQLTDKMIITFVNVNEEVLSDEKLRFQAERDELTGLYNRRTFLHKVEEMVCVKPANTYFMSVGDIDNFKLINDRYGHAEGDKLLQHVAGIIQADVDRVGGLCGRLGSDLFATLTPLNPAAVKKTHGYPQQLLANYPLKLETTFSIGYYIIDTPSMAVDGMLDRASMAKQTVKGNYETKVALYDEKMRQKLLVEQDIAGNMEEALRNGLFDIYLQPQFNHVTGQICGAEALVRWLHPNKGVIYLPGEFIPLFERNGFITRLDDYVWNRTAELLREWLAAGNTAVPVSVNVSRLDTNDPALCSRLLDILERNRIPIELFRLEITESLFEKNPERLTGVVNRLHEAGFLIEMDDFGSGYSSLNILKDVPVDILKLDMRFFTDTENKERSGVILNAVMRMARWLNIPVIAEGVEDKGQADYLASIGCPIVQGYLYEEPMPVSEFEELLRKNSLAPRGMMTNLEHPVPDTKDLWTPNTPDARMFYNYMDAAVIFEYRPGVFETLLVNQQLLEVLQFSGESTPPGDTPLAMHPDDVPLFFEAAERAIASGKIETVDARRIFEDRPDVLWLRCALRSMPSDGDSAVLLCTLTDITKYVAP